MIIIYIPAIISVLIEIGVANRFFTTIMIVSLLSRLAATTNMTMFFLIATTHYYSTIMRVKAIILFRTTDHTREIILYSANAISENNGII